MSQVYQVVKNTSTKRLLVVDTVSDLPETATTSTLVFVRDSRRLYIYTGVYWLPIATENEPPTWATVSNENNIVLLNSVYLQKLSYDDPEQVAGTFSFNVSAGNVNALNSVSLDSNNIIEIDANVSAQFTLRFTATDGANIIEEFANFVLRQQDWAEITTIRLPNEVTANSNLGSDVALNNNFMFLGAPGAQQVIVYKRDNNGAWSFHSTIAQSSSGFGTSIDSNDDQLIVGAPTAVGNSGEVWLYRYNSSTDVWANVTNVTGTFNSKLGTSVAISGSYVAAGAPDTNTVIVYNIVDDVLETGITLNSSNITGVSAGNKFGQAVAMDVRPSGTIYLAVGAPGTLSNTGNAYNIKLTYTADATPAFTVFDQTVLTGQFSSTGDEYGFSVDILEYEIAVGAPNNDVSNLNSGIVYVYKENPINNDWLETDTLLTGSGNSNSLFGSSVKFNRSVLYPDGNYVKSIVIGSQLELGVGAMFLFKYNSQSNRYLEFRTVSDTNGANSDFFGRSIATQNNIAIIGAPGSESTTGLVNNTGKGVLYELETPNNTAQFTASPFTEYLKVGATSTRNISATHPDGLTTTLSVYSVENIPVENASISNGVLSVTMPSDATDNVIVNVAAEDTLGRITLQSNTFIPVVSEGIFITSSENISVDLTEPKYTYPVTLNNVSGEVVNLSAVPIENLSENQLSVSGSNVVVNDVNPEPESSNEFSFRVIAITSASGFVDYRDVNVVYS